MREWISGANCTILLHRDPLVYWNGKSFTSIILPCRLVDTSFRLSSREYTRRAHNDEYSAIGRNFSDVLTFNSADYLEDIEQRFCPVDGRHSSTYHHRRHGRSYEIPFSDTTFRHRCPRFDQGVYPLYSSPYEHNPHRLGIRTSIRRILGWHTMGRANVSQTEDTVVVQMRESAEGGGVQSARGISCLEAIDGR